jgi:molecular chaperone GrpE
MTPKEEHSRPEAVEAEDQVGDDAAAGPVGDEDAERQPVAGDASASDGSAPSAPPVEQELEAARDRHLRLAAEYDNFRKRTERERTESWSRAQAQLVSRLLDALDDLQRVGGLDVENTSAAAVVEGVQLVERKLHRALEGAGLERIDGEGDPFDPEIHEALVSTPTAEREMDDTVAEVFQPGYLFKGVLLRPARVRVQKYED